VSGWFDAQIVDTGRLPLFCFFVAFIVGFGFIRLSVRLIRAQVRWWPGNVETGTVHVHHMAFGVVFMAVGGVAEIASPAHSVFWRTAPAALFGVGMALVLDEFALILHLRDVYWTKEGRLSVDAVFVAIAVTALLLIGVSPAGVSGSSQVPHTAAAIAEFVLGLAALFALAAVTLLKGKVWTGLFGIFIPPLVFIGAVRIARPRSPWARWRYSSRPAKASKADRRERRYRAPAIRWKIRVQDLLAGSPQQPGSGSERKKQS
jgi:hypothetical protein